jgi:hypothetical protein
VIAPVVARLTASYVSLPLTADGTTIAVVVLAMFAAAAGAACIVARTASREAVVSALREE